VSTTIVWKKALQCISVAEWDFEFVIIKMKCDSSKLLKFSNKCKVPEVEVIEITGCPRLYDATTHSFPAATVQTILIENQLSGQHGAYAAIDFLDNLLFKEHDAHKPSWYARHNFTNLKDGDVVSWYDHSRWIVGETKKCDKWYENAVCGGGIHCFLTRELAEAYRF
jgi:hypothetical protein